MSLLVIAGSAGVAVGHPIDTVKVVKHLKKNEHV